MVNYINQHTSYTVTKKKPVAKSDNGIFWIFTQEGKDVLNANGYFSKTQIKEKIKLVFEGRDSEEAQKLNTLLINVIKNM
jgi:hypothetical protein